MSTRGILSSTDLIIEIIAFQGALHHLKQMFLLSRLLLTGISCTHRRHENIRIDLYSIREIKPNLLTFVDAKYDDPQRKLRVVLNFHCIG